MATEDSGTLDPADDWWKSWWENDYSWDGLKAHLIRDKHVSTKGGQTEEQNLQTYWRFAVSGGTLRSEEDMQDELIQDPTGRTWHLAHVPLRWDDGTPAKETWTDQKVQKLRSLIEQRLKHSRILGFEDNLRQDHLAHFEGAVLLPDCLSGTTFNVRFFDSYVQSALSARKVSPGFSAVRSVFEKSPVFTEVEFPSDATFERSVFLNGLAFNLASVNHNTSFAFANFYSRVVFHGTKFHGPAYFFDTVFRDEVEFDGCCFGNETHFTGSYFFGPASFEAVQFLNRVNFDECVFQSRISFRNASFNDAAFFTSSIWPTEMAESLLYGLQPAAERALYNARFKSAVVFTNTSPVFSLFDGAIFDGRVHLDLARESELNRNFRREIELALADEDAQKRLQALHGGCQTLRRAMEHESDKKREFQFYQFELLARRYQDITPKWEKILSYLYDWLGGYGSSIGKPISSLFVMIFLLAILYGLIGGFQTGEFSLTRPLSFQGEAWRPIFEGLGFSAGRAFPFGPWTPHSTQFQQALLGSDGSLASIAIRFISTCESIASAIFLFLSGLAVRRRFQIG